VATLFPEDDIYDWYEDDYDIFENEPYVESENDFHVEEGPNFLDFEEEED